MAKTTKTTTSGEPGDLAKLSKAKRLRPTFWERAPRDLSATDSITWARQNNFLLAFSMLGTKSHAARKAHVAPTTVAEWFSTDKLGFRDRFYQARLCFNEALENIVYKNVFSAHPDRYLLQAALRAAMPEKWGERISLQDDRAADLMERVRALPNQLPAPIEADYTPLTLAERAG